MHKLLILINTLFPVMAFGQAIDLAKAVGELTDKLVSASKGEVVGVEGDSIRLVDVEKGVALTAARVEVAKTSMLADLLAKGIHGPREGPAKEKELQAGGGKGEEPPVVAGASQIRSISFKEAATVVATLLEKVPQVWSKISRGLRNDILIALSGRSIGATVVTRNGEDFRLIQQYRTFPLEVL